MGLKRLETTGRLQQVLAALVAGRTLSASKVFSGHEAKHLQWPRPTHRAARHGYSRLAQSQKRQDCREIRLQERRWSVIALRKQTSKTTGQACSNRAGGQRVRGPRQNQSLDVALREASDGTWLGEQLCKSIVRNCFAGVRL